MLSGRYCGRLSRYGRRNGFILNVDASFHGPRSQRNASEITLLNGHAARAFARSFSGPSPAQSKDAEDRLANEGLSSNTEEKQPLFPQSSTIDPSSPHNSLATFQRHALRTGLSRHSAVYTGTAYEYLAQSTLCSYGIDLYRVGGRGDRGVDLIGIWNIPLLTSSGQWKTKRLRSTEDGTTEPCRDLDTYETLRLKVLVQCKRLVGKHAMIRPSLIRELDGAVRGARNSALFDAVFPQHSAKSIQDTEDSAAIFAHHASEGIRDAEDSATVDGKDTSPHNSSTIPGPALGVLVSTKPATKGVVDGMRRSTRGLVWVLMEELTSEPSVTKTEANDQDDSVSVQDTAPIPSDSPSESAQEEHDDNMVGSSTPDLNLRGRIKQILWNQAARDLGLEGVDVVKRYDSQGQEEVVLMRGGRVWGGTSPSTG